MRFRDATADDLMYLIRFIDSHEQLHDTVLTDLTYWVQDGYRGHMNNYQTAWEIVDHLAALDRRKAAGK